MRHSTTAPIAALLAGYRPRNATEASDVVRLLDLLTSGDPWSRDLPLHVTASALVVHPPTRRVLLRWHARMQSWLQIGGHGDPGEYDPIDVVLREGREETHLDDLVCWPDAAVRQVAVLPVPASLNEPAHEHADLRFVLATETPEQARPERPTATLRWLSLPEAHAKTTEPNLRELLARVADFFDQ
ncbi:NUDIX hydrolase [Salinispora pacifica]|uniref:NUDIX hydrolase n=1 Tax=Salinispora pacifica TaxID=351187 RepID=UPI00035F3C4B|nr:NUDIX domain-containing protein [Salinispora pacifica]